VSTTAAIAILLLSGVLLPPVTITAVGARHRGQPWHLAAVSGVLFPAARTCGTSSTNAASAASHDRNRFPLTDGQRRRSPASDDLQLGKDRRQRHNL